MALFFSWSLSPAWSRFALILPHSFAISVSVTLRERLPVIYAVRAPVVLVAVGIISLPMFSIVLPSTMPVAVALFSLVRDWVYHAVVPRIKPWVVMRVEERPLHNNHSSRPVSKPCLRARRCCPPTEQEDDGDHCTRNSLSDQIGFHFVTSLSKLKALFLLRRLNEVRALLNHHLTSITNPLQALNTFDDCVQNGVAREANRL